jgi:2-keto-4-pentenoate hydratase
VTAASQAGSARAGAAALLVGSRLSGAMLGPLPSSLVPADENVAYQVQRAASGLLSAAGYGRQAGWKIGCTTEVMQAYLGISSPCAGRMFQARVWHGRHAFATSPPRRLGVECEIAVRMGSDLPQRGTPYEPADAAGAVAACMAAIEVVQDRYEDYPALDTPTLIADDFFHHSAVIGGQIEDFPPDRLREVTASMSINGQVVGSGAGSDIMGEPLTVLAWLANGCISWGTPIQAGDIILLGSLVQTNWVEAGDTVVIHNEPFGEVRADFR